MRHCIARLYHGGLATTNQFIIVSKDLHYIKISKLCTKLAVGGKKSCLAQIIRLLLKLTLNRPNKLSSDYYYTDADSISIE